MAKDIEQKAEDINRYVKGEIKKCRKIIKVALRDGVIDKYNICYLMATRWELIGIRNTLFNLGIDIAFDEKLMRDMQDMDLLIKEQFQDVYRIKKKG